MLRCANQSRFPLVEGAHRLLVFHCCLIRFCRDGHYGLYLDETLTNGSSARCPTFNNDPLCASDPNRGGTATFECVGLEVWGVGPP
jgi:TLD